MADPIQNSTQRFGRYPSNAPGPPHNEGDATSSLTGARAAYCDTANLADEHVSASDGATVDVCIAVLPFAAKMRADPDELQNLLTLASKKGVTAKSDKSTLTMLRTFEIDRSEKNKVMLIGDEKKAKTRVAQRHSKMAHAINRSLELCQNDVDAAAKHLKKVGFEAASRKLTEVGKSPARGKKVRPVNSWNDCETRNVTLDPEVLAVALADPALTITVELYEGADFDGVKGLHARLPATKSIPFGAFAQPGNGSMVMVSDQFSRDAKTASGSDSAMSAVAIPSSVLVRPQPMISRPTPPIQVRAAEDEADEFNNGSS